MRSARISDLAFLELDSEILKLGVEGRRLYALTRTRWWRVRRMPGFWIAHTSRGPRA